MKNSVQHGPKRQKEVVVIMLLGMTCLLLLNAVNLVSPVLDTSRAMSSKILANRKSSITTLSPEASACKDLDASIPMLTRDLALDPETNSLRPWSGGDFSFQGLDNDLLSAVFHGHRVALFGDSTLHYFTRWLKLLLEDTSNTTLAKLPSMNLTEANQLLNPSGDHKLSGSGRGTHFAWYGISGPTTEDMCYPPDSSVWKKLKQAKPEILVVNQGLHWLHFLGQGRDNVPGCTIKRWIEFEQWLEEVVLFSEKIGVKVLLFKTTNRICIEKFRGHYASSNTLYTANDRETLKQCSVIARSRIPGGIEATPKQDIDNYCQNATFNNRGSLHLNARLKRYVEGWKLRNENKHHASSLHVGIFNDYGVESCDYSKVRDGRHYHPLNLLRIRLLANTLHCLIQKNTTASKR